MKDFFERIQDRQAMHGTPLNFLQLPLSVSMQESRLDQNMHRQLGYELVYCLG